jgi:hypothetical protein
MRASTQQRALRLVHSVAEPDQEPAWFCGKCAAPGPRGYAPAPDARVCRSCGLGLLLETRGDHVPDTGDAFIVVDSTLTVQAVSEEGERVLGIDEASFVHRPIKQLLTPANAGSVDGQQLIGAIIDSISGSDEVETVFVRPLGTFGVRMRARISACGPPRAALIVLETSRPSLQPLRPLSIA